MLKLDERAPRGDCNMHLVDGEHHVYQCDSCRSLWQFEADGPRENDWHYCPCCGRYISSVDTPPDEEDEE